MDDSTFSDICRYIGFSDVDSARLREFAPVAESHLPGVIENFYQRIEQHPAAFAALDGEEQIQRLKGTLLSWLVSGLSGPHDLSFYYLRSRIGHTHVRIGLPQRYMLTAMNGIRLDMRNVVRQEVADAEKARATEDALDRLFDLELAIMLESYREASDSQLRRRERLATMGLLAANIAHELRNPLGVMESSLYLLMRYIGDDPRLLKHVERTRAQVDVCSNIISNLLEMARRPDSRRDPVIVKQLFSSTLDAVDVPDSIKVVQEISPEDLAVHGDSALLTRALANLIGNAVKACSKGGTIRLTAELNNAHFVLISVEDDGPGFDPDVLNRVFEPLVTTRADGIGLGLALVKNIVERHHGRVEAGNHDRGGAFVHLRLPLQEPQAE